MSRYFIRNCYSILNLILCVFQNDAIDRSFNDNKIMLENIG